MRVKLITPERAAAALAGIEQLDPTGQTEPGDLLPMCERGACFELTAGDSTAVYVLTLKNGVVWVDAGKGTGPLDLTNTLREIVEHQAQSVPGGARSIAMQTARRGLVRKLGRQGYRVTGYIITKDLQC